MKRLALAVLGLALFGVGCQTCQKDKPVQKAATGGELTAIQIRTLLDACENHAKENDETRFRGCLTRESVTFLDRAFTRNSARIGKTLRRADSLDKRLDGLKPRQQSQQFAALRASLVTQRRQLQDLQRFWAWKAQLLAIARAPKAAVEGVKVRGDAASFLKRVGTGRTKHFLARASGSWKVDLKANPDFGRRLKVVEVRTDVSIKQLEALAATLDKPQTVSVEKVSKTPAKTRRSPATK